jgi:hypothetical protein
MGVVLAAAPLLALGLPARAADNSAALVPADASYYSAMLRNKEQIDAIAKSKAWKRLTDLPLFQEAVKKAKEKLNEEGGPGPAIKKFYEDKDNKDLANVLLDAVSHEIFLYAGKGWGDLLALYGRASNSSQFAALGDLISGGDGTKAQVRALLLELQKNKAQLKTPELVIGFKVSDAKKVEAQLKRLEKVLGDLVEDTPPLKGRFKRAKVGDSSFLTLTFDGGMVPWDDLPIKDFEDRPGEFDDLFKHLKAAKLTVSLGVRNGYLLLGVTPTADDLLKIGGKGKKLIDRDELKPLVKNAKKKITSISYVSKECNTGLFGGRGDYTSLVSGGKELLAKSKLPEAKKKAIAKDLEALAKDLEKGVPELGASLAFEFMTETGYEGFSYDYAKHDAAKGARLKLLDHFGGNPIFAAGFGTKIDGKGYATFVKWLKVFHAHAEDIFLSHPDVDKEVKDQYEKVAKDVFPLLRRLDETTSTLLLPALKDASFGLVVDAKWKSKQWVKDAPPLPQAMPMLEVGLVLSLADAAKFQQAMKAYRTTLNEIFEKAGEAAGKDNVRDFRLPVPEQEKGKAATYYFYKIPEDAGIDKQFRPTAGVSKKVAALTLSKAHTQRLLKSTPLAVTSGPLVEHKKDLIAGCYFNNLAFIDAVSPWVEFGVMAAVVQAAGEEDGAAAKKKAAEYLKQVRVALDVLKVFQSYSSATYLEGGVLVTHRETIIKDR